MSILIDSEVADKIERLDLPFNRYGLDPYGISKEHLARFFSALGWFYRHYFRVKAHGMEWVPERGRVMVVGNHSGGLPVDAAMVLSSLILEHEPPRLGHGMAEKFAQRWPFVSSWFSRLGQLAGLTEHAVRLLEDERVVLVFPEGARGTGKLFKDRYKMVRFGSGFMRLALQTRTPIVPFAFLGGEEALPTVFHIDWIARLLGAPYFPVPIQVVPFPLPVACEVYYGEPMLFEGDGNEPDEVVRGYVRRVRERIETMIAAGLEPRGIRAPASERGEEPAGDGKEPPPSGEAAP